MFGLLYMLFGVGVRGVDKVTRSYEDAKSRSIAKQNGDLIYSWRNQTRLTENGRPVGKKMLPNGHEVLVDLYSGKVYYDYTKAKDEKEIKEAVNNGKTVLRYGYHDKRYNYLRDRKWYKLGIRPEFIDIKTKQPFKIVFVNHIKFYINLDNGYLVRPADGVVINNGGIDSIINTFNKYQDLLKQNKNYNFFTNWMKRYYYCDCNPVTVDNNGDIKRSEEF